jgi:hypothetical protein
MYFPRCFFMQPAALQRQGQRPDLYQPGLTERSEGGPGQRPTTKSHDGRARGAAVYRERSARICQLRILSRGAQQHPPGKSTSIPERLATFPDPSRPRRSSCDFVDHRDPGAPSPLQGSGHPRLLSVAPVALHWEGNGRAANFSLQSPPHGMNSPQLDSGPVPLRAIEAKVTQSGSQANSFPDAMIPFSSHLLPGHDPMACCMTTAPTGSC